MQLKTIVTLVRKGLGFTPKKSAIQAPKAATAPKKKPTAAKKAAPAKKPTAKKAVAKRKPAPKK